MKTILSKAFAVLLCVALAVCMLAVTASAEETYAASVGETGYATVAEAVANANGETVKLLADSAESVTASGDLYLDLNGYTLAGLDLEDGKLYGMDTTTDDYTCADGYGKIVDFTGAYAVYHQVDVNGNPQRYLTVEEGEGVSFHRFYLAITHKSLAPATQGVGYKALFCGDHVVKQQMDPEQAFGYTLQLDGFAAIQRWKGADEFAAEKTLTLRVNNYDEVNYGQTQLKASVQIQLANGTIISSTEQSSSLKEMMETINSHAALYSSQQLYSVGVWVMDSAVMQTWAVQNILYPPVNYDMNVTGQDLVIQTPVLTGSLKSVALKEAGITLENATLLGGKLTVPAASFMQSTMPSGAMTLVITTDTQVLELPGNFTWVIHNWTQLSDMEDHLVANGTKYTGSIALVADIDVSAQNIHNYLWKTSVIDFNGTFDGRGHTISGVNTSSNKGLFRNLGADGVIRNLHLTAVVVDTYAGGLVGGQNYGRIENVYIQGTITNDGLTGNYNNFGHGLLAGRSYQGAIIRNVIAKLDAVSDTAELGTAFGKLQTGTTAMFENCYVVGQSQLAYAKTPSHVITRYSFDDVENCGGFETMNDLWQNAQAKTLAQALGLTAPDKPVVTIKMATAYDMNVTNAEDLVIVDRNLTGSYTGTVTVRETGTVLDQVRVSDGKLVIPAASFKQDTMPSGQLTLELKMDAADVEIVGQFTWVIHSWNDLSSMEKHLIADTTAGEYTGALALGADIDLTGKTLANFLWKNIASFNGEFDGRNHTLSNFEAKNNTIGLFKNVGVDGVVKNLKMTNVTVSTYTAAVIGGSLFGKMENIYVQGSIIGDGVSPTSNLTNFGCGLVVARVCNGSKVHNCIAELTYMADNLRLATAFGKLHSTKASERSYTNCYAVNAARLTFMPDNLGWVKMNFTTGRSNENFDTMADLWNHPAAAQLAQSLGLQKPVTLQPEQPDTTNLNKETVTVAAAYDANGGEDFRVENGAFTGANAYVTMTDTQGNALYLANAVVNNGALEIPADSFKHKYLPTGQVTITVITDTAVITLNGIEITWLIHDADEMLKLKDHLILDDGVYQGSVALAKDVDMANVLLKNMQMQDKTFAGSFDGRGYAIKNLNANNRNVGLFGNVSGTIQNVRLLNAQICDSTAALVGGLLTGTMDHVYAQGVLRKDGTAAHTDLTNLRAGLLVAEIGANAKVSYVLVEISGMSKNLYLATAFGKLQSGTTEGVFENCYAVASDGSAYMQKVNGAWSKQGFASTNSGKQFKNIYALWNDDGAAALATYFGLTRVSLPAFTITMSEPYDMNAAGGKDFVLEDSRLTGNATATATIRDSQVTLSGVTVSNGKLTIPAASFKIDSKDGLNMPSGQLTLIVELPEASLEISGEFIWMINSWAELAYMERHMVLNSAGTAYTGSLALGADVSASGKVLKNFLWKGVEEFSGTFDGRNHTISDISIASNATLSGLFKVLGVNGVIKNLKLTNAQVATYASALVGSKLYGTLENVYVQGTITGDGMGANSNLNNFGCGLLAARIYSGAKINNCIVDASIKDGLRLATAFGKLEKGVAESVFTNCYSIGAESQAFMGQVAGAWTKQSFSAATNASFATVSDLFASGNALAIKLAEMFALTKE